MQTNSLIVSQGSNQHLRSIKVISIVLIALDSLRTLAIPNNLLSHGELKKVTLSANFLHLIIVLSFTLGTIMTEPHFKRKQSSLRFG